jgi:hypothetical protein
VLAISRGVVPRTHPQGARSLSNQNGAGSSNVGTAHRQVDA